MLTLPQQMKKGRSRLWIQTCVLELPDKSLVTFWGKGGKYPLSPKTTRLQGIACFANIVRAGKKGREREGGVSVYKKGTRRSGDLRHAWIGSHSPKGEKAEILKKEWRGMYIQLFLGIKRGKGGRKRGEIQCYCSGIREAGAGDVPYQQFQLLRERKEGEERRSGPG